MIRTLAGALAAWASRAYVAGPGLEDALRVCRRLAPRALRAAVGFWNAPGAEPRGVARAYLAALDAVAAAGFDCRVCVKPAALGFSAELLDEVFARALERGGAIHFDAVRAEGAAPSLAALAKYRGRRIGCTLPARWQRSVHDVEPALDLGAGVRVVKGEQPDPERDLDLREGYLALIDRLAGRARQVGVATHDAALAREALRRLRAAGTPCELELLFGLPLGAGLEAARELGVPVRIYVPYGSAWLPYCLSRVRQNPRILAWLARDALLGRAGKLAQRGA